MFEVGSTITLSDNNKFIVAANATLDGKTYYYLIGEDNPKNVRFCTELIKDNRVFMQEFTNKETLKKLYSKFMKSTRDFFDENPEE